MTDARINIDGVELRFRDSGGGGPAVLMLHGIGGSLELWSSQFVAANRHLRLIALDLPGHGLSDFGQQPYGCEAFADCAWRFLDALGIERPHLVGNSMGGAVSLLMLARRPQGVSSLLLAASAGLGRESPPAFRLMSLPLLGELMARPGPLAVRQQIDAIFDPSHELPDELRRVIERNVMRPGAQQAFVGTLRQMAGPGGQRRELVGPVTAALRDARVPLLLLHGGNDKVLPSAHSEAAARLNPRARLRLLDGCGHTPQLERAVVFGEALRELVLGS